jgi:hypothetical protein
MKKNSWLLLAGAAAYLFIFAPIAPASADAPSARYVKRTWHGHHHPCGAYRCGCPDRWSCYPLYGAYGPYGGVGYWGAYSSWRW